MVLATTGPRTFSDACLSSILATSSLKTEEEVWRNSYAIMEPTKLGNAVILGPASCECTSLADRDLADPS